MRKEVFCEILGDIDETYVKEAGVGRRAKKSGWMRWGGGRRLPLPAAAAYRICH